MNIDKKLDEILDDFKIWSHSVEYGVQKHNQIQPGKAKQEIKQLFQELLDEVIGKNPKITPTRFIEDNIQFVEKHIIPVDITREKDKQRQRAKELLEKL